MIIFKKDDRLGLQEERDSTLARNRGFSFWTYLFYYFPSASEIRFITKAVDRLGMWWTI